MVTGDVNRASPEPSQDAVVAAYLADLSSRLMLCRRSRADVLAEVADGLACAAERRVHEGVPAIQAARAAVLECGPPAVVAAAFNRQRLAVTAHRLGFALVATGPTVGLAWIIARTDPELGWPHRIAAMLASVPLYPAVLGVTVSMCVLAYSGAGFVARLVRTPTPVSATAAIIAMITCVVGDVTLIGGLAISGEARGTSVAWTVVATAASTARLSVAAISLHRLVRLREGAK